MRILLNNFLVKLKLYCLLVCLCRVIDGSGISRYQFYVYQCVDHEDCGCKIKIVYGNGKWILYSNGLEHTSVLSKRKRGMDVSLTNKITKVLKDSDLTITPIQLKRQVLRDTIDKDNISGIAVVNPKSIANLKYRLKKREEKQIGIVHIDDLEKWIDSSICNNAETIASINDNQMVILSKINYTYSHEEIKENGAIVVKAVSAPGIVFSSKNCIQNFIESINASQTFTSDGKPLIALNGDGTFNLMREKWTMLSVGPRSLQQNGEKISHHYRPGKKQVNCIVVLYFITIIILYSR